MALTILCWILAAALVAVGFAALVSPQWLAHVYGAPADTHGASGYVRATGIRDLVLGAVLGAAIYFHHVPLVVAIAVAGVVVSIADFAIVYHHGGKRLRAQHAGHASGIVAFILVIAMALFAFGR